MNEKINQILDGYKEEMISQLQKFLQIKSLTAMPAQGNAPFGLQVQEALDYCLALGEKKGFECKNFDNYAAEINFGQGNDSIGVMTHLDVVPEGNGWTFPPYEGKIHDGKIYGRGAVDDKGCLIASFYACLAIKESGLPIRKKIKHIIGTNEENGTFPCMQHYKSVAEVPTCGIVPDSWFPAVFAEKGILSYTFHKAIMQKKEEEDVTLVSANGGEALNVVAPFATAVFSVTDAGLKMLKEKTAPFVERGEAKIAIDQGLVSVTTIGKSAHASTPEIGVNAVAILLKLLETLTFAPLDLQHTLKILSGQISYHTDGSGLGIKREDHTGPLTNNIGLFAYEQGKLEIKMNIRAPITYSISEMESDLSKAAKLSDMNYERINYNPHFYVDPEGELFHRLVGIYQEMSGDVTSKPKAHGGGSYARIFENFIPFGPSFQGEELVFHKQDEYISCDRLLLLSKIYAQALYDLAK